MSSPFLSLAGVSFGYISDLFTDVSLDLGPGWHGLVGANGAGKTTLLQLIASEVRPRTGTVTPSGPVVRCRQVVDEPTPDVLEFAASFDPPDFALRGRLGLEPEMVDRWETLSPGERRRWQVTSAIWTSPDVLLLDEPTNHLDAKAIRQVMQIMRLHRGVGIVVSHDRRLLDEMTSSTMRIVGGRVEVWGAGYTVAREEWLRRDESVVAEERRRRSESKRLERRLDDQRRKATEKTAEWKRSQRLAKPGDHDATSTARTQAFREGQAAAGARLSELRARTDRAADAVRRLDVDSGHRGPIAFAGDTARREVLVEHDGPVAVDGYVLVDHVQVVVGRTTRLWITGSNGAGKSSLMNGLVGRWQLPTERLFHLPQDLTREESRRRLGSVLDEPPDVLGRVMQLFARLGGEPEELMASSDPSPGEVRKLLLASALVREVWCMMLDEPTNHLDLETVEALEEALMSFPGSLVLITHDARFARALSSEPIEL